MSDNGFKLDEATKAIADEMLNTARAERKARQSAKKIVQIIKIMVILVIVVVVLWLAKPFIMGNEARDRTRQRNAQAIANEISSYKTSHRNNLPMEGSRRQWEREFVQVYLEGKEFIKDPSSQESYQIEINRKRTVDELNQEIDFKVVHIDQSAKCAEAGDLTPAGSSVAAVRLKLESGQIYCVDIN